LRMRTQEQFPNFGEVDDLANFEEIQRGLACLEDEWVYMHRGLGIPGRVKTDEHGIITAPATDEAFMREYIKEWKRLMQATAKLGVRGEVEGGQGRALLRAVPTAAVRWWARRSTLVR